MAFMVFQAASTRAGQGQPETAPARLRLAGKPCSCACVLWDDGCVEAGWG